MYMCTNTCMMNSRADCEVCNITGSHWIFDVKECDVVGMIETSNTHINAFYKGYCSWKKYHSRFNIRIS